MMFGTMSESLVCRWRKRLLRVWGLCPRRVMELTVGPWKPIENRRQRIILNMSTGEAAIVSASGRITWMQLSLHAISRGEPDFVSFLED